MVSPLSLKHLGAVERVCVCACVYDAVVSFGGILGASWLLTSVCPGQPVDECVFESVLMCVSFGRPLTAPSMPHTRHASSHAKQEAHMQRRAQGAVYHTTLTCLEMHELIFQA